MKIGQSTSADTHYSEAFGITLPPDLATFVTVIAIMPDMPSNRGPFAPQFKFDGDIANTPELEAWVVESILPSIQPRGARTESLIQHCIRTTRPGFSGKAKQLLRQVNLHSIVNMELDTVELVEDSVNGTNHMRNIPTLVTIQTPSLSIGCEISGVPDGSPVILLHGWPDDVRTWDGILPSLHQVGLRTIVPYLRGFGATQFRGADLKRVGQLAALGQDVIDLADALSLKRFAVVGHDWGARAAYIASCLVGIDRISHCAALSVGWGTNDPNQSLGLRQVQNYWYHWYMALDRGAELVRHDRRAFTRHIWTIWNPNWSFSDAEFERTAASFDNPDWAEVVLHSYRVRWGLAPTDPALANIEARLAKHPEITCPTLVIHGGGDPCNDPSTSEGKERFFKGPYQRVVLDGVGHFPQREAPTSVAKALVPFLVGKTARAI